MRRFAAVLAVVAAGVVLAAPAAQAERWRPGLEEAREYAGSRAGTISFALRTRHRLYRSDAYRVYRSASVVKAMLLVAYLNHDSVRGRKLTAADHALLDPMIRRSDNVAATRVRDLVGNGALEHLADRVGMGRFASAPSWGDTQITQAPHLGWALHFKGGWGDYGEVDHQVALLRRGKRRIAVAILMTGFPTHKYGKQTLEGIARRLLRGLGPRSRPR